MLLLKKLFFAVPCLIFVVLFLFLINPFFKDYNLLFSLELNTLYDLIYIATSLVFAGLAFAIFAALANDWKIVSPVSLLIALTAFFIFPASSALIIFFGMLISLTLGFALVQDKLKSYLTFNPINLLAPGIKNLGFFVIISVSVAFYLTVAAELNTNGFKIPDSILDTATQFTAAETPQTEASSPQLPELTPQQLQLLQQNPDLLKQYGIDPALLDLSKAAPSKSPSQTVIKNLLKSQLDKIIQPYIKYLPLVLTILFIITLQSLFSIVSIFLPILIFLIFWILEKTGYIHFDKEMREVKKLVV